jgi:hypothetical protein
MLVIISGYYCPRAQFTSEKIERLKFLLRNGAQRRHVLEKSCSFPSVSVVRPGRTFLRELFNLLQAPHHLTAGARAWYKCFL